MSEYFEYLVRAHRESCATCRRRDRFRRIANFVADLVIGGGLLIYFALEWLL